MSKYFAHFGSLGECLNCFYSFKSVFVILDISKGFFFFWAFKRVWIIDYWEKLMILRVIQ